MSRRCRYCGKPFDVGPACRCASYAAEMIVRYGATPQTLGEVFRAVMLKYEDRSHETRVAFPFLSWWIWAAEGSGTKSGSDQISCTCR